MFCECANYLGQRREQLEPQVLSTTSWAFARADFRHETALRSAARLCTQTMSLFKASQDVANSAWALAKLDVDDAAFFQAMFSRAGSVLYSEEFRDHMRISHKNRVKDWAQVYYAYRFCLHRCPEGLEGIGPCILHDLRLMGQMRTAGGQVGRAFSDSSGLNNSEKRLRELDKLIEAMERGDDDLAGGPIEISSDSLEALPITSSSVALQAAEANARLSQEILGHRPSDVPRVVLLSFSRSPEPFRRALLEGPELAAVRAALEESGYDVLLASGAKFFVHPEQYESLGIPLVPI